jgi:hypothetical protein
MQKQNQHGLINHVALVIDKSSSMQSIWPDVSKAFENLRGSLEKMSRDFDQEVRVSVYAFSDQVECRRYDTDVFRAKDIMQGLVAYGNTALKDAVVLAVEDLKKTATLYGDHAFVVYAITDGEENCSRTSQSIQKLIEGLPENWTVCLHVPSNNSRMYAEKHGFPRECIAIWNTSNVEAAAEQFVRNYGTYVKARSTGTLRGTKSFFSLDTSNLNVDTVHTALSKVSSRAFKIVQNPDKTAVHIKPLIEASTGKAYVLGNGFYQLVKKETIQPQKEIAVLEKSTGDVFRGPQARGILNLPNDHVQVSPTLNPNYDVYVQSTSVNRNIIPQQKVLYFT